MRSLIRRASARSLAFTAWNNADCRSAMTLPEPERRPLQPSTSELNSHAAVGREHVDRRLAALQFAHVHFMLRHIAGPVLDGADGRHLLAHPDERIARIALTGCQRILERNQRQACGVSDAAEMLHRHGRRLTERERRRREHQERRGAPLFRHPGDAGGFEAAVGPDAVDDRQLAADLVLRDGEHAALLIESAGGDLGRMGVHGDGGEALDRRDVLQMLAEALLVDDRGRR